MMTFWKSIGGYIEAELISADPEAALSVISATGVELFRVKHCKPLTCSFLVRRRDYTLLLNFCKKRGESLRILKEGGVYYSLLHLRRRKLLLCGMSFLLFSALYLPSRVLFIRVEGNDTIPSKQILSAAENNGIHFGSSRRHVRSERVKNALLDAVPQLQWAGINTSGCTAVISVRERVANTARVPEKRVSSIVADRDGYILSTVVTRGTALVQPGQAVKSGQTLISGYTECGICIEATRAEGEIIALTHRNLEVVTPSDFQRRTTPEAKSCRCSVRLGKKRIFFWKGSGISDTGCGRMYKEYAVTLPGGFRLPITICIDCYERCGLETSRLNQDDATSQLESFARQYLKAQMVAGNIQSETYMVNDDCNSIRLLGSYTCTEVIGKEIPEQIGETNAQTG